MTTNQTIDGVLQILAGIDKTQSDSSDGWWETSIGARFGKGKLKELRALLGAPITDDGVLVPRELLIEVLSELESDWRMIDSEWGPVDGGLDGAIERGDADEIKKLRALLDAPTCKTPSGAACPGDGVGPCKKCPAAKPQGEPVAVKLPARDESLGTAENDMYANGWRHGWNAYEHAVRQLGPLYAEQPAPVAVAKDE